MNQNTPRPDDPKPSPAPNPEPARPPSPPETPPPDEPPGIPPPSPDPILSPDDVPPQIPPETPPEVPPGPSFPAPTATWTSFVGVALLCWMAVASPVAAEASNNDDAMPPPGNPCQADPEERNGDTAANGAEDEADADAADNGSAQLRECNGVLTPPNVGDTEIEEPAPDTGTTPIIPPGQVPEQPPD